MTRALLTGASGFIGRGAIPALRARGFEVHGVTSRRPPDDLRDAGVHWHHADLLSPNAARELIAEIAPTHLLHLAWYAEPGAYWTSPLNVTWVEASLRLLRLFAEGGGERAVLAGSCAEYEWTERVRCVERETPRRPATLYGTAKHALRILAERYAEQVGLSLAWGHVFFVFGPHENPARLGSSVASAIVRGQKALCTHGEQMRDFLYSEDLADAFAALTASQVEGPVNLASGNPMRIRDLVEALAEAAGRPDLLRLGARPASASEPTELLADVTRLHEEVGWHPVVPLEQRARDTVAWWRRTLNEPAPRPAHG